MPAADGSKRVFLAQAHVLPTIDKLIEECLKTFFFIETINLLVTNCSR